MRFALRPAVARLVAWGNALVAWSVRRDDRRRNAVFWAGHARRELDRDRFEHAIQSSGYAIVAGSS